MQVRYLFSSDSFQSRFRLAAQLLPRLNAELELKGERVYGPSKPDSPELYALLSRPLLKPQFQIFHGWPGPYAYHPLQWNILLDPPRQEEVPQAPSPWADEIWVFSAEAQAHWQARCDIPVYVMPPAVSKSSLQSTGPLPLELEEPHILLASLPWEDRERRQTLLNAYLPAFQGLSDYSLMLHLNKAESQDSDEESLLQEVLSLAENCGCDPEKLNLQTWIGPLEGEAYLALLERSEMLLLPTDEHSALEALSLGKKVLGLDLKAWGLSAELQPDHLKKRAQAPAETEIDWFTRLSPDKTVTAMLERLKTLEQEVDFEQREQQWHRAQTHQRQGRKQQYSLFHSDYDTQEMQARRQWHQRYAQQFKGAPGDVLDIGCGSGIFLELMRELNLPAFGLDPDPDMVAVCEGLQLQAMTGDERLLSTFQAQSLGGIHASHVIEHVDGSRAIAMVENALRILRPGGKLVIRTPNWKNEMVRHEGFWLDITHIRPYPLPLLKQVLTDAGFEVLAGGYEEFGWSDTFIVGQRPERSAA